MESDEQTEFDILQEQLNKASKTVGGKKFVLDRYGKPVVVGKVSVDSLPPMSVSLELDANKLNPNAANVRNGSVQDTGGKRGVRVAGSLALNEDMFKATTSLATTLSGMENITKIGAGVVVRSSKETRKGDAVPENPDHMSRKQYMEMAAKSNRTVTGGSMLGGDSSMFSKSGDMSRSQFSTNSVDSRGAGASSMLLPQSMKNIDHLPPMDKFEGSRKIQVPVSEHDLSDEELGLGEVRGATQHGAPRISSLHKKASEAQRANMELIGGAAELGKPRDRDLPKNMRPVAERKHLPAPPLGQTVGHGNIDKMNASMGSPTSRASHGSHTENGDKFRA